MERTVPSTESEEVELYLRTYYSLLRSTADVQIRTLEEVHAGMNSVLHREARHPQPDMAAFIYSLLRLPACMPQVELVVLGQSPNVFVHGGYSDFSSWQEVAASARRRRCYFDGKKTLACLIASQSDIDDLIPILTAYQIEWNKLNLRLQSISDKDKLDQMCNSIDGCSDLADVLEVPAEDLDRLYAIWDQEFNYQMQYIAATPRNLSIRLLGGSLSEYRRATHTWWNHIEHTEPDLRERPVYFVSSNKHSLLNLLSGFALLHKADLIDFIHQSASPGLVSEWNDIQAHKVRSNPENFLYYVYRKFEQAKDGSALEIEVKAHERACGIVHIPSKRSVDLTAQVIEISRLNADWLDPRLAPFDQNVLAHSDALILNIDYPLGLAAYNVLTEVSEHVGSVRGVYVLGKAATLNGVIGDVMIPNVVHDEHSKNTYLFPNCFNASDVRPYLVFGTVLDNQKAVTVQGTFLQNDNYMDVFYREGYTDIEMEAGPYLSAVYEMYRPRRHPIDEIVNLYGLPFELGIIHYASDTPLSKGKNLAAGSLSYYGMDPTYATSVAILRRIFRTEYKRLTAERSSSD
jgi:hypothetical protein